MNHNLTFASRLIKWIVEEHNMDYAAIAHECELTEQQVKSIAEKGTRNEKHLKSITKLVENIRNGDKMPIDFEQAKKMFSKEAAEHLPLIEPKRGKVKDNIIQLHRPATRHRIMGYGRQEDELD